MYSRRTYDDYVYFRRYKKPDSFYFNELWRFPALEMLFFFFFSAGNFDYENWGNRWRWNVEYKVNWSFFQKLKCWQLYQKAFREISWNKEYFFPFDISKKFNSVGKYWMVFLSIHSSTFSRKSLLKIFECSFFSVIDWCSLLNHL